MQEKDQECLEATQKSCQLEPLNPNYHQMRAQILFHMGRLTESRAAIEESLSLHDRDPNLFVLKADVLKALGDLPSAEKTITEAINMKPAAADYRFARAKIRFARKNFAGALQDTDLSVSKNNRANVTEARNAWILRAQCYASLNDKVKARDTYLQAIQTWPIDRQLLSQAHAYFKSAGDRVNEQSVAKRINDLDSDLTPPKMPI